jgi:GT2 family glycosyltransferase
LIDVIVPAYRGFEQTRRCVESVLASVQRAPFALVVVDDASPEPAISRYLDSLAGEGRIELLRNESNQGFVRSVNRAMELHRDRDVVLLNSDTEVANDWLDRLDAAAGAGGRVATVTPFSNNATICSYPYEGWSGGVPGTLGLGGLDRLFASTNAKRTIDIPTAVGFCMLIRRACLDEVGLFDAERYGRGYGEENDFCMRSGKAGWRHVLAGDTFVFHEGGVSFSEERHALVRANALALVAVHPEYNRVVHEFILADPARELRDAVDLARMRMGAAEAQALLAERSDERARLLRGLLLVEKTAAERESAIGQLNYALEHAGAQIADREKHVVNMRQEVEAGREELRKLRDGLRHAESLAFSRLEELERIYRSPVWRVVAAIRRRLPGKSAS